jgi:hypothetical protein
MYWLGTEFKCIASSDLTLGVTLEAGPFKDHTFHIVNWSSHHHAVTMAGYMK